MPYSDTLKQLTALARHRRPQHHKRAVPLPTIVLRYTAETRREVGTADEAALLTLLRDLPESLRTVRDGHAWLAVTYDELAGLFGLAAKHCGRHIVGQLKERGLIVKEIHKLAGTWQNACYLRAV